MFYVYYCPIIFSWSYSSFCSMISLVAPLSHLSPVLWAGNPTQGRESLYKKSTCQINIAMLGGCIQRSVRELKADWSTTSLLMSCPHAGWSIHSSVFMGVWASLRKVSSSYCSGKPRELCSVMALKRNFDTEESVNHKLCLKFYPARSWATCIRLKRDASICSGFRFS